MKILFVTEFFPQDNNLKFTGGVEAYSYYLVRELVKKHQVTVICRRRDKNTSYCKLEKNLKIYSVGIPTQRIDTGFWTIPSRLIFTLAGLKVGIKEDFDLVQGNNFVTYPLAFLIATIKRKPSVAWYPDVFIGKWTKLTGFLSGTVGALSEKISLKFPWNAFVALSESTRDKLLEQSIDDRKITTIYAGVDIDFFKKIKPFKENKFTICCISRLVNYKRIDLLIKAAKILKDQGVDFSLKIIGEGPEKDNLLDLAKKLELTNLITFKSKLSREKLAAELKSSHLFCLPSQEEGFGLVVIEAAACGIPFVVSDLPVLKEVTHNGTGGTFFKSGDERDLALKINQFMKDRKIQEKLIAETEELVKNYTWEKISRQFENVYRQVTLPKILMLVDAWFPHVGGGQIHAWELSKELAKRGCKITIFTRNLGPWSEQFPGVKVVRVGHFKKFANLFGRIEYLVLALFYSLFTGYDILHAHAFSPGLIVPFAKFFRHKKIVFTAHGKGMKIAGLGLGGGWLEKIVFYKIPYDAEITVAKNTFTQKPVSKKVWVIPNGVDSERFGKGQRERGRINNILYIGRLNYDKGVDLLIEAFKQLDHKNLKLRVVGDGPERVTLEEQSQGLPVTFTGRLEGDRLVEEYKKADLLVMPSLVEGQPIRLFEAWASKLPVVATRAGDNELYIKDGQTGFLANIDSRSLLEAIKRALNSDTLKSMVERNWQSVQQYSWEKIADQTLTVYLKALYE
jgi:glycosyltransferase involved in cell wall biosynthesis